MPAPNNSPQMTKRLKKRKSFEEILLSVSDVLFPAELGKKHVEIDSKDVDGDTPLHVLIWRNDVYGAQLLIKAGADVNAIGDMGETPLHVAISKENEPIIVALLEAGADTNIRSEFGETAIEKASKKGESIKKLFRQKPPKALHRTQFDSRR